MALVIALVYALHQDIWLWHSARPLVFGFLPAGLAYHAAYTIGISVLMLLLVRTRWPSHLEDANERQRVSHASGVGPGAPASERVGGFGGAKPPDRE